MIIGIIPNTTKSESLNIVNNIIDELEISGVDFLISENIKSLDMTKLKSFNTNNVVANRSLYKKSDIILSVGGDGTLLTTAYEARDFVRPIAGINLGKLGFLAEIDQSMIKEFIRDIKLGDYIIENRMSLSGKTPNDKSIEFFAINDIVIDKGSWPKMIEISIEVDGDYVTTFTADGVIIATPTGTTGYSLSTGGPIVSPKADAITINPISPHTLTMRPLVLSSGQTIRVKVNSQYKDVQINCDGQRVNKFKPCFEIEITKSDKPFKLLHIKNNNYFQILQNKLFWGLDVRKKNNNTKF